MKQITSREAYKQYVRLTMNNRPVTTINQAKLNLTQRTYLEAKQQWAEMEVTQMEIRATSKR